MQEAVHYFVSLLKLPNGAPGSPARGKILQKEAQRARDYAERVYGGAVPNEGPHFSNGRGKSQLMYSGVNLQQQQGQGASGSAALPLYSLFEAFLFIALHQARGV